MGDAFGGGVGSARVANTLLAASLLECGQVTSFRSVMERIRAVDADLIRLNEADDATNDTRQLEEDFYALRKAANSFLVSSI